MGLTSIWQEFSSNNLRYNHVEIWMGLILLLFFILPAFLHSLFDKDEELKTYPVSTDVISLSYCLQLLCTLIFWVTMIIITN